jgi:hypothetical protein
MSLRRFSGVSRFVGLAVPLALAAVAAARPDAEMTAITMPVTGSSIASTVTTIGVTVLTLSFTVIIGFAFAKKLLHRVKRAV